MTSALSIQPELLFTTKGADLDGEDRGVPGSGTGNVSYEFGYLEIPLLLKLRTPTGGAVRPNVFAGPTLGIKLYGELDDDDLDDELKSTDWGITAGAGLDFASYGRRTITLDGRYTWGLVDVFDVTGDPEARNAGFIVTLGIGL